MNELKSSNDTVFNTYTDLINLIKISLTKTIGPLFYLFMELLSLHVDFLKYIKVFNLYLINENYTV